MAEKSKDDKAKPPVRPPSFETEKTKKTGKRDDGSFSNQRPDRDGSKDK